MHKFVDEKDIKNKEALLGALSSFIRGLNHDIKQEFLTKRDGAEFLRLILEEQSVSSRLQKKVIFLINNLISNHQLSKDIFMKPEFLKIYFDIIKASSDYLDDAQHRDIRENALRILGHSKSKMSSECSLILKKHRDVLAKSLETCNNQDKKDLYDEEMKLLTTVIQKELDKEKKYSADVLGHSYFNKNEIPSAIYYYTKHCNMEVKNAAEIYVYKA